VVRDKDGIGAALVAADMAAWCKARGTTLLGYLEEIQRQHGLFVADQKNFTFPGSGGAATIARIMEGFREAPPARVGELAVNAVLDYKAGERRQDGATAKLTLPPSNVIAYELEGGSRITLRPSGTEPKIKYYVELKEQLGASEPIDVARRRAGARLHALIDAFVALARERGQP
jgi:phosphomannomutase